MRRTKTISSLTQEQFDALFTPEKAEDTPKSCIFLYCRGKVAVVIVKDGRKYGVCKEHWDLIGESNIQWEENR